MAYQGCFYLGRFKNISYHLRYMKKYQRQHWHCCESVFRTRMDIKTVSWKRFQKLLFKPEQWQIVEFRAPNQLLPCHLPGAILVNKLDYQSCLTELNPNKKVLINGPYFEMSFYYHFLLQHHYKVYLLRNKPNVFKYKRNLKS